MGDAQGGGGSDVQVQGTNDDAQISKLSCVRLGYWQDDFIQYFVTKATRRSPLINRGYYSRNAALRWLLGRFLALGEPGTPRQVLSLGAGFDTTWFQLQSEGRAPPLWVEVDFAEVTRAKVATVARTPALAALLGEGSTLDAERGALVSGRYCVQPADLRELPSLEAALAAARFDATLPTFILCECVLVYMEPRHSAALVRWLGARCRSAACVVYEQIRPHDAFGVQMLKNLQCRGCPLKGIAATPDLAAHCTRFLSNGWQRADALDMDTIYSRHLDPQDRRRAERLEIFDEFEEWHMIQQHYAVTLAVNDDGGARPGMLAALTLPPPVALLRGGARALPLG